MLFAIAFACTLVVISLAVAAPQPPIPRPELIHSRGGWSIRMRAEGDLVWLQHARTAANPRVTVPASVRPGRWLAAILRPDNVLDVRFDESDLAALLPGTNTLSIQAPGYRIQRWRFDASPLFRAEADLRAYAEAHVRMVGASPNTHSQTLASDLVSGLSFTALSSTSLPDSNGSAIRSIPIEGKARRVYALVEGQNGAVNGRIAVRCVDGTIIGRPARLPDDLTWRSAAPAQTLAEIDLGEPRSVEALEIYGAAEVGGVTLFGGLRPGAYATLSRRAQTFAADQPIVLFGFDRPSLEGWEIQGGGWGTTDTVGETFGRKGTSRYFADSKAVGGEPATGSILSPPFTATGSKLTFLANGHSMKNYFALVDAKTGEEIHRLAVPEKTGPFEKLIWDIRDLKGRRVRFKAVDADTRTGYAWLAFDEIALEP